jgi:hypothetical protein
MRRVILAALVAFALSGAGFSESALQTPGGTTTFRRIQVNARTITSLRIGKKYVVDLTRRGVKYEFGPEAGQIDFRRVVVRTAQGDIAIGVFLEKTFLKDKFLKDELSGFKYASQSFILGTPVSRTPPAVPTSPSTVKEFSCGELTCACLGRADCSDLIFDAGLCGGSILCWKRSDGKITCICSRH